MPCSPLSAPSPSISFITAGSASKPLPVRERIQKARRGQHLEALVDADEELRRHDRAFDRAELHALDLARHRAQLAGGIDLDLDAAARILFDHGGKAAAELLRRVVDGRGADLHHVGLVVAPARRRTPAPVDKTDAPAATIASAELADFRSACRLLPSAAAESSLRGFSAAKRMLHHWVGACRVRFAASATIS